MTDLRERDPVLYSTGIKLVDDGLGGGIAPGELAVVGASTSHGKTLFGLQIAYAAASRSHQSLIISEEMTAGTLAERGILHASEVEQSNWKQHWEAVFDEVCKWEDAHPGKIQVPEVPVHTVDRAAEAIAQAVEHFGCKMVIVDYLQLLDAPGVTKYEQVSNVSRGLKQAAVEHSVAVVALAQLNRSVDKEAQTRGKESSSDLKGIPQIHHLSDSGQIERDADIVMLLQWPHRTNANYQPANEYRVYLGKNRNRGIRGDRCIILQIHPLRQMITERETTDYHNYEPAFNDYNQERF
jgi:replicative DNA helicase